MSARLAEHGKLASDQLTNTVVDHFTNGGTERMDEASQVQCFLPFVLHHLFLSFRLSLFFSVKCLFSSCGLTDTRSGGEGIACHDNRWVSHEGGVSRRP